MLEFTASACFKFLNLAMMKTMENSEKKNKGRIRQ